MKTLSTNPNAVSFVQIMATETGRKARLGDAEKVESGAAPFVLKAHIALRDTIDTVARLTEDKTRTEVAKHAAAAKVVSQHVGTIKEAAAQIKEHADAMNRRSLERIDGFFNGQLPGEGMSARISGWIAETAKTAEGIAKIKQAAKEDVRVAAVAQVEPLFLTGITKGLRDTIVTDAIVAHLPEVAQQLTDADALLELPAKYEKLAAELPHQLYTRALADQAATRVEI